MRGRMKGLQCGIVVQKMYNEALPGHNDIWGLVDCSRLLCPSPTLLIPGLLLHYPDLCSLDRSPVFTCLAFCRSNLTIKVPPEYAYLLPRLSNNTFSQPFINITLPAGQANDTIEAARHASFISCDPNFDTIIGNNPTVVELASSNTYFAFDSSGWGLTRSTRFNWVRW